MVPFSLALTPAWTAPGFAEPAADHGAACHRTRLDQATLALVMPPTMEEKRHHEELLAAIMAPEEYPLAA